MHKIGVLALHGFVPSDLAIPCDVFSHARLADGACPYAVQVCGVARRVRSRLFDLHLEQGLAALEQADTIVVPGIEDIDRPVPPDVLKALQRARDSGVLIASICSGAFVLAQAGLLENRRATTHWLAADVFAVRYPTIDVDPDVLFVDEGQIITSAGATAGIDMCLHIIARHHGQAVAADSSRRAVAPLGREGGQRQFILRQDVLEPVASGSIAKTLEWIERQLDAPLTVDQMASHAGMSKRTFARRFVAETGTTPGQWLIEARTRHARFLLETTRLPVDEIAAQSGFADSSGLRDRFRRVLGVSPRHYRASFGTQKPKAAPC